MKQIIKSVFLEQDRLFIIDQRLLPKEEKIIELRTEQEVFNAIKTLAVRGAPAIGIAAAYGVFISAKYFLDTQDPSELADLLTDTILYLKKSRPTAYNLFYALDRMEKILHIPRLSAQELLAKLKAEALAIHREDLDKSDKIAEFGLQILKPDSRVLTHCNTGGLATGGNGTALGIIFRGHEKGLVTNVFVDETRPLLQGARLTAWELQKTGIPYTLITDSMAGTVMRQGKVDAVIVGADRIARNGDFANKIGTYSLAVLCHYHGIPFYTAAPFSTFDLGIENGREIPVEERPFGEVTGFADVQTSPNDTEVFNPAFDVTPHELVTGIICEKGVLYPPYTKNIKNLGKLPIE